MDKIKVFFAVAIIFALLALGYLLAQIERLTKEREKQLPAPVISLTPTIISITPALPISRGEEEIDRLSRKFIHVFGSFSAGNYDNIRAVMPLVSARYRETLSNWILERQKSGNKTSRYTIVTTPIEVKIISLKSASAQVSVETKREKTYGYLAEGRGTLMWYDENGQIIYSSPKRENFKQTAELEVIKENDFWKVDNAKFLP